MDISLIRSPGPAYISAQLQSKNQTHWEFIDFIFHFSEKNPNYLSHLNIVSTVVKLVDW